MSHFDLAEELECITVKLEKCIGKVSNDRKETYANLLRKVLEEVYERVRAENDMEKDYTEDFKFDLKPLKRGGKPVPLVIVKNKKIQSWLIKEVGLKRFQYSESDLDIVLYEFMYECKKIEAFKCPEEQPNALWLIFLTQVQEKLAEYVKDVKENVERNVIQFDDLWYVFQPGQYIVKKDFGTSNVMRIEEVRYEHFRDGSVFTCSGYQSELNRKGKMVKKETSAKIQEYSSPRAVHEFEIHTLNLDAPLDSAMTAEKNKFILRSGRLLSLFGNKEFLFCHYEGTYRFYDGVRWKGMRLDDRIVIDEWGYQETQNSRSFSSSYDDDGDDDNNNNTVTTEEIKTEDASAALLLLYPLLHGYDLHQHHQWGWFNVDSIRTIEFEPNVLNRLRIPGDVDGLRKQTLVKLLNEFDFESSDVIKNKNSGLIILLHGNAGVGKTLSAEVAAEHLQKPLYYISTGTLGLDSGDIEDKMKQIQHLCLRWKAIALLDEADVFLEERNATDIRRNALVGCFLKILEYYNGMLFLTTNRVKHFDTAVQSRLHVTLTYADLTEEARGLIWKDMMAAYIAALAKAAPAAAPAVGEELKVPAELKNIQAAPADPQSLEEPKGRQAQQHAQQQTQCGMYTVSVRELNGRQLRTIFNVARTLAKQDKTLITEQHVQLAMKLNINR